MPFDPPLTVPEVDAALGIGFQDISPLLSGGQGAVFKATHRATHEAVALKIYYSEHVQQRAEREVDVMLRIRGDTLVSLLDSGTTQIRGDECVYIATKYVAGVVMSDVVNAGRVDIGSVARCGCDIASAIQLLWAERIVHRDINPKNLMLTSQGRFVLIDLGVARHLDLQTLTASGFTWGTPGYMSPEQAGAAKQLSFKSDVFALGITLQEFLAGRHPLSRRQDLLRNGGPATSSLGDDIPRAICEIIDAMVRQRAYERPCIQAIKDALQPFGGHEEP